MMRGLVLDNKWFKQSLFMSDEFLPENDLTKRTDHWNNEEIIGGKRTDYRRKCLTRFRKKCHCTKD